MHRIVDENGKIYTLYNYDDEPSYEKMIVENAENIFGKSGIYFDIKKRIGEPKKGATIPDGYFLDLTFHNDPRLYLVEVELQTHDVYAHIGEQILRFGISSEMTKYKIKSALIDEINKDDAKYKKVEAYFKESKYGNINELLDEVIFNNKPSAIVIIDQATEELYKVLEQLAMDTEVIEAQTYTCEEEKLHRFTPFKDEVITSLLDTEDADELDTIVVPAREDGFNEEFLQNERWYAIRISNTMLDKIKYIASYQVAPISGITYIAEIERIEKYNNTNKYIVYFKTNTTQKIEKVGLGTKKGQAPQAPRYTSYNTIINAKTLDDIWK